MKLIFILFLFTFFKIAHNSFQEITIEGKIMTYDNKPVALQKIKCEPTNKIYYTDKNGEFNFITHLGEKLIIKRKGYKTKKVTVLEKRFNIVIYKNKQKDTVIITKCFPIK